MKNILTYFLLLALAVFASVSAPARDMRFPEHGNPAFAFEVPDDWTTQIDRFGNMHLTSANHHATFSLTILEDSGPLDDVAADILSMVGADAAHSRKPMAISGFQGYKYFSSATKDKDVQINLELTAITLDSKHVATCTLMLVSGLPAAEADPARTVERSITLIGPE
jgi:hypothetical protein